MQSMALMAAESSLMSASKSNLLARVGTIESVEREEIVGSVVIVVIAHPAVAEMAESQEEEEDHLPATSASSVATLVIGKQHYKFG